ncbi:hypothetical protein QF034_007431 [Streptomyces africanus]|uniref:Amidohydrolase n=1 Tax=Streptomyces africanus TaxID=231024 RepID=A0ABU0R0K8_9ACTN|nr:hypothetical protein [Streptomyces africanus]
MEVTALEANNAEGVIDTHHHVWDPSVRDQDWITGRELAPLSEDLGQTGERGPVVGADRAEDGGGDA